MLQNRLKYLKAYPELDKNIIIEVQRELIERLKKDVGRLEAKVKECENWKASSKDRHAKGREKTKNPTKWKY